MKTMKWQHKFVTKFPKEVNNLSKFNNIMSIKLKLTGFFLLFTALVFSQQLEKTWKSFQPDTLLLEIKANRFCLENNSDELFKKLEGKYEVRNDFLLLFPENEGFNGIGDFRIIQVTDSTLVLSKRGKLYHFKTEKTNVPLAVEDSAKIIPNQGFSVTSLWRGALGMFVLLCIAYLFSNNRRKINWKTVIIGLSVQLLLAIGVLKVLQVQYVFEQVGSVFVLILDFTKAGSEFLLGGLMDSDSYGFIFVFQVLPTIVFFSALTSVLFYLGVIQVIVRGLAWVLTKILGISGAESLSVAGNIFLGQTEAPLMIKAYLEKMTRSEILLVMIGGMATVAGGVLAAYIGFLGGNDEALRLVFAKHLLAASVMAAPGAIVVSKMLYPQEQAISTESKVSSDNVGANILDAIANGTTEGLKLAANVAAMLLVFVAFIAMINYFLGWLGDIIPATNGMASWFVSDVSHLQVKTFNQWIAAVTPYDKFSLETILGLIFSPLMWIIGVAQQDMMLMGQLLGIKLAASEFVGYIQLAELKNVASGVHFTYEKSVIMATYMLCGFANFASIGIQIGGIGSLAPGQRKNLSQFGMKAVLGGSLASLLSATIAGMIIG
ncbi:NupC/NupG family nucleoside CNT transporter [Capnocytophaga canimorsus]|uniref:NupC/NupG family nucleoside CNT transporter n=1 Tax=Capnocytophaga canimorsus TaxID=28188 RepID=UPI0037DD52AC